MADLGDPRSSYDEGLARPFPNDLPRSLDDRRPTSLYQQQEVEEYDPWQGRSNTLTVPAYTKPINFNLALEDDATQGTVGSDGSATIQAARLARMSAAKSRASAFSSPDAVLDDVQSNDTEKRTVLQSMLTMAASNGELNSMRQMLNGRARDFVDLNQPDVEGTPPLIYASCFGHEQIISLLLDHGADVNGLDKNRWSALMWATTNKHKSIVKLLLDHQADPDIRSSTGRTVLDFIEPDGDMSDYLHGSGYQIGTAGVGEDFYNSALSQDRFEEELAESEMRQRMMMESAINLEVDLGNLGHDEKPETPEEFDEGQEFVWDRCLNDQMFVFQESELDAILDIVITNMTPQRSPTQKPVPANIIFLAARYAHYHSSADLLERLLLTAMDKINDVVESHQWDMTILAFWTSNATLLLYYLKKDAGLVHSSSEFQLQLAELINEIFILIIRDAERRMDKVLDAAILDHDVIPGFEDVQFQDEWKIFRSKVKAKAPEPIEKLYRPPSPRRRAQSSPRNITSLLSSTLFVLDLYDIHSVITAQVLAQLFYWLGTELFNRVLSNRKYLARTKAMQIRMNISTLEDWARSNNRQPEHFEAGSMTSTGEDTIESARRHLSPLVQLLQWLQCLTSFSEENDALIETVAQLPRLSPQQLLHAAKYYRAEVGEKGMAKTSFKYLESLQKSLQDRRMEEQRASRLPGPPLTQVRPQEAGSGTPSKQNGALDFHAAGGSPAISNSSFDEYHASDTLLLDPAMMLPFILPTATDMLVCYGAGFGGTNTERARKYVPTVPPEFLARLDIGGSGHARR